MIECEEEKRLMFQFSIVDFSVDSMSLLMFEHSRICIYTWHTRYVYERDIPHTTHYLNAFTLPLLFIHTYKFVFFYPFNIPSTTMIWHWNEKKNFLLIFCGINCPYYVYVYKKEFSYFPLQSFKIYEFFSLPFFEYTNLRLRS